MGPPQELAGLGVGCGRNGAGIQHHHVGVAGGFDHPVPCRLELPGQFLAVRLVELATVGVNGHCERTLGAGAGVSVHGGYSQRYPEARRPRRRILRFP